MRHIRVEAVVSWGLRTAMEGSGWAAGQDTWGTQHGDSSGGMTMDGILWSPWPIYLFPTVIRYESHLGAHIWRVSGRNPIFNKLMTVWRCPFPEIIFTKHCSISPTLVFFPPHALFREHTPWCQHATSSFFKERKLKPFGSKYHTETL